MYIYIYNMKYLHIFQIVTPKHLFSWEVIDIVYKRIQCSVRLSNNQATQITLMPVGLTEQKVKKGEEAYVSPHTIRAQSCQHCSVILHFR